ncbi:MAG TPA: 5-oxoprolinase/urea amidolyase family protein [Acidisoma sp.]|nr:5-oxoprolinase/urea amidolyase family protein [Acidisoma sp.]
MTPVLRILMAGPGVTLQDGGRQGYLRFGVTPAGPMDRLAFNTANRALNNPVGTTAIEVGLGGLEFTVEGAPLAITIAGGDFTVTLDGGRVPTPVLLRLDIGAQVKITAGTAGAWCYVALGGRLQVTPMLGSNATHTRSGFGGIEGRGLMAGDRLGLEGPHLPAAFGVLEAPWLDRPADVIRVVLGTQDDYFTPDQVAAFLAGPWRVSARGDRMAYFLEGAKLEHAHGFNIVSDGVAMGAVQVPGEGQPIVLMADRQPTGGYPKIATVIGPDLGRLAQARPGQSLRFEAVTVEAAVAARRAAWERLEAGIAVHPLRRTEFSSAFLLGHNLTDGVVAAGSAVTSGDPHERGKLTARERLEVLFDDATFVVLSSTAQLCAQGRVEGRPVYAVSRDAAVRGGALNAEETRGLAALLARAVTEQAPVVLLFDSMATMEYDDTATMMVISALHETSSAAAPRIAVVMGPCVGPDALLAARADFLIATADHGFVASAGPALVQALTNEILTGEEIGGPAALADAGLLVDAAANDVAALLRARRLVDFLSDSAADNAAEDAPSLDRLVPHGATEVYDIRDLLTSIADEGEVLEIAAGCAGNLIAGFARFGGRTVGIIANQPLVLAGALDAAALAKAALFAERCAALGLPLLTIVDCPGLLPTPAEARAGLLRKAAALMDALSRVTTPRVTLVTRNAAGMVPALLGVTGSTTLLWPSAAPPAFGTLIAPQETRCHVIASFGGRG